MIEFDIKKIKAKLKKPIVLVGLMGVGKTSLGKMLANKLQVKFTDTDAEIEKSAGCTLVDLFALYGEQAFLQGEEKVINRVLKQTEGLQIISTGDSGFTHESVRKLIKKSAISIWLKTDVDTLAKRTRSRNTRPLLLNNNHKEIITELFNKRYDMYSQADITITISKKSKSKTVYLILEELKKLTK